MIPSTDKYALQKATLLLAAVALNALELAIPRLPFLPWLKPGLANIITVLWIIKFGFKDALLYTALRIWISGFYFGFSLFTLSLSFCGGMLSTIAMSVLWITLGKRGWAGTIGIAVTGALFHNAGQLAVVYVTMAQNMSLFAQVPFMIGAAIVFGGIVGATVPITAKVLESDNIGSDINDNSVDICKSQVTLSQIPLRTSQIKRTPTAIWDKIIVLITFTVCVALMFIDDVYVLIGTAILFSLISSTITKKPITILYPVKFYILFLFIAITHLLLSTYGTRLDWLPFATKEGLSAFAKQSLRLWCWLQTVHIFKRFKFHEIFIGALYRFFPNRTDTLQAGMIALEHFPEIARLAKSEKKAPIAALLFRPKTALMNYMDTMTKRIARVVGEDYGGSLK